MPRITFLPDNITVDIADGQSVFDAAIKYEIHEELIYPNCSGNQSCASCHVIVRQGLEYLGRVSKAEAEQLCTVDCLAANSRLGCCCRLYGNQHLTVELPLAG